MDDLLTTQDAARLMGTGATAVKRWADAGLLACIRTAGGHRRFLRSDIGRFVRARPGETAIDREPWVGALLEASEPRELESLLLAERARAGAWHRVAETAGEALTRLGELWRSGSVTILEEHLATERLARALSRVTDAMPLDRSAPRALLACAEGDDHTMGLALVELVLREAGWSTLWAGRKTPTAELEPMLRRGGIRMLALSASSASSDAVTLRHEAEAIGRICRASGAALALGGSGRWPDRPRHGSRFTAFAAFHAWAVEQRHALEPSNA